MFMLVECLLYRLSDFLFINIPENKNGLGDLSKFLECFVERVLVGVGVEPVKELGGSCFFELDGCHETKHVIPLLLNECSVTDFMRKQFIPLGCVLLWSDKGVALFSVKVLNPGSKKYIEKVHSSEHGFGH